MTEAGGERVSLARKLLNAAKGGATWAAALATGDVADEATVETRRAICRDCPARTIRQLPSMTSPSAWCGEPFADRTTAEKVEDRSCGCLLFGKTLVASQSCPQDKWRAVPLTVNGQSSSQSNGLRATGAEASGSTPE